MKKIGLFTFLLIFFSQTIAGELSATLDRKSMAMDETVELTVIYSGKETRGKPNFSALKKDFDILGTSQSRQFSSMNGKNASIIQWSFRLSPKQQGKLTIPGFELNHDKSQPLTLDVSKTSGTYDNNEALFLKASIHPKTPYVQSQLIYKLQIFLDRNIQNPQLTKPIVNNATVMVMGEDKKYAKAVGRKIYQVLERDYAIIPHGPGKLTITSPILSGAISETSALQQGVGQFFSNRWKPFRIATDPLNIDILPIPPQWKQPWWLPAESLTIDEQWSERLDNLKVGEPITRTLTIDATGLSAEQLPQLTMTAPANANIYPDKPILETSTDGTNMLAKRIEKFAIVPKQAGDIELPEINLTWWNINEKRPVKITLPARKLTFTGTQQEGIETILPAPSIEKLPTVQKQSQTNILWMILAGIFFILWLLTLLFKGRRPRSVEKTVPEKRSQNQAMKSLKAACFNNHPSQAKAHLLEFFRQHHPNTPIHNLSDLQQVVHHEPFKQACQQLNEIIYQENHHQWDGHAFFDVLKIALKQANSHPDKDDPLKKLYPNGEY